jgi:hypothetical protein
MKVSALLATLVVVGSFGTVACGDDDAEPRVTCKYEFETVSCGNCVNSKCCRQLSACNSGTCMQLNECKITNDERCVEAETEEQSKACFTQYCGAFISQWDKVQAVDTCMHEQCAEECDLIVE